MRAYITGFALLGLAACAPEAPSPEFDQSVTIFTADRIYTGNPDQPIVSAVIVGEDGRILDLIHESRGVDLAADAVTSVSLPNGTMFPGFVDGHAHLLGIGQRELTLNLEGTASIADLTARIKTEVDATEAGGVIIGRGWIETGWPEGRMPSAADLDAVAPDHSVILMRSDGHALVANTRAMFMVGITPTTPDPDGGSIERGPDGVATGIFIDNAMGILSPLMAEPSERDLLIALAKGGEVYAARGWTGVHNMSVTPREAPLLERLSLENRMPLRLNNAYDESGFEIAAWGQHETPTIRNRSVKVYMDGALGSRGALLIAPYADRPDTSGLSLMEPGTLSTLMDRADSADVQLAIHAIGDLANRRILDAFETSTADKTNRWRIEHTQVLASGDIARVGALGLIASMQPSHAIGDLKFAPARLGNDRLAGAYAWRDLLDSGAVIVGGSDAPVEVGSPLIEFYAAVARKDLSGFSDQETWHPEQAVSREEALAMLTSAPAYAAFMEDDLGTIEIGKIADFTVFDRDLMTVPEADILTAKPLMTVVGGEIVWRAESASTPKSR